MTRGVGEVSCSMHAAAAELHANTADPSPGLVLCAGLPAGSLLLIGDRAGLSGIMLLALYGAAAVGGGSAGASPPSWPGRPACCCMVDEALSGSAGKHGHNPR